MPIVLTKMEEDGKGQPSERSSDNLHSQTSNREKVNLSDDPSRGLDQTLALLQQRNDTSRFVGLALLKSILDNKVEFQKDSKIISQCWDAVPVRFLDRLLKTGAGAGGNEEARDMVEIAVAVLHTFMMLLPEQLKQTEKFSGRIGGLLNVLPTCTPGTQVRILQILLNLACVRQSAIVLLRAEQWVRVIELAVQQELALDIIKYAFMTTSSSSSEGSEMQDMSSLLESTLDKLTALHWDSSNVEKILQVLSDIVTKSSIPAPPSNWLDRLSDFILQPVINDRYSSPSKKRHAVALLTASLLHTYPLRFPHLLFSSLTKPQIGTDSSPVSYLFIKLLLVDIRSTIPSLQEKLNSDEYSSTSARLAASYDILSSFIGFLIQTLDQSDTNTVDDPESVQPLTSNSISPSLLLQFRSDVSEAISLTIEHLRDRFDASVAGAASLSPSARLHSDPSVDAPLAITWESSNTPMAQDPLTLSQLRTLALWLREDDNDALRKEAAGILDVLLSLYTTNATITDFRSPVLIALQGITAVPEGIDVFIAIEGWTVLFQDLSNIPASSSTTNDLRGTEIVRVLLSIVEADVTGPPKEEWLRVIELASTMFTTASTAKPAPAPPSAAGHESRSTALEFRTAVAQLAVELLTQAPRGVRKRYAARARQLAKHAQANLRERLLAVDAKEALEEVLVGLQSLGIEGL